MNGLTLLNRREIEPKDMKPTHILHREFYKNGTMRITVQRYADGSFIVTSPIELSDEDILSIDWSVNTFGYRLTYPDGVTTGQWVDTPRDFDEVNPFSHLLGSSDK